MKRIILSLLVTSTLFLASLKAQITKTFTLDSLGACQGISYINDKYFAYGDREIGVMRSYTFKDDSLHYSGKEYRFTIAGVNSIKHPTGIAYHKGLPTFVGNSVRQNAEGTLWKALIYHIDWDGFLKTGTLDGNLKNTIEDDACIQGTRPEYVFYKGKWLVATADYGEKANEVRLYDPKMLKTVKKTSEKGVVLFRFKCSPLVQNLHWINDKGVLILIQNQIEGRKWRLTYIDLAKSIDKGSEVVLKVIETDKADELEGLTLIKGTEKGIAVSSAKKDNASIILLK